MTDVGPAIVSRQWQPVLGGALRERARTAIDEVAAALWDEDATGANFSLAGGTAGLALFHTYLADARDDCGHKDTARRFLRHATHALRTIRMEPSLYGGFTGVGWAVQHLDARLGASRADRASVIDEALIRLVDRSPWRGEYDLVSGLVGYGVYARAG